MARKAKVDVNKADRDELAAVPGIGPSTAEALVKLRFERGGFRRLDELAEVPGIGEQTLEGLRQHLSVTGGGEGERAPVEKTAADVEKSAATARQTADEGVASAVEAAKAVTQVASATAATQAEVSAQQTETAQAVSRSVQEQVESAYARQQETMAITVSSGSALLETAREANQAWLGFVQDQIWANLQTAQMLARCRSPKDVIEVQSNYVRSSIDRLAEEQARFADLAGRMVRRVGPSAR